jgi:hypothetical protein
MSIRQYQFAAFTHAPRAQGMAMRWSIADFGNCGGVDKPVVTGVLTTL